ncbi:hypothetical protein FJT64_024168 [Amphibalanus amphitrite]|uniref:Endonuclease/exonuclease/phosphatase domain-containing protein n=1 Tax=Amphibalanus amphitrite TaxID=1232801 RepID=A0A6A4WPI8_AMPAM|nr:hypothetical protein FJT64_024168 [Amphibalanus amphitrite]
MHRDVARLLILLAVVRVLSLACIPAAAPSTAESSRRREPDRQLRHHVTPRRPADPRPSGLPSESRPSRPGAAEPSPGRAAPPRAGRGHRFVRLTGDLSAADTALACGHVTLPALRPAACPADPGDVTPAVRGRPVPRPADLSSAPVSRGRPAGRRSGGRRPQRRGARGRGSRRSSRPTSASRGLLIGALNVQSLRPKLRELSEVLHRQKYDIVLLAETWLKPTVPNRLLVIPSYSVYREDRPDGRGYGGVAVVAMEDLTVTPLKPATQRPPNSRLETVWSLVRADRGRRLVLCSLYRPPRYTVTALDADFRDLETQVQSGSALGPLLFTVFANDLSLHAADARVLQYADDTQVRYCISVYGNGTKKNMVRVQKILNFAAKVIFGRGKFDHVADLRERLGWLEAQQLADHSTLCLAHRVLRRGEPHSLAAVLHRNEEVRQRATRQDGAAQCAEVEDRGG